MNILAIETTEPLGSVAALSDANLLCQLKLHPEKRSAQSLAPAVKGLLERVGWRPADVALVAVTAGPGSFTGLRVGVTTAKTLAYCVGAGILGIDTLEAIAEGAPADVERLSVAVDAQRGQVVAGWFHRGSDGFFAADEPSRLMDAEAWLAGLAADVAVAGPVLEQLADRVPAHLRVLDRQFWHPTAAAVGRLAWRRHAAGFSDDVWSLVPRYSRPSAAEEKWQAKER